MTASTVRRSFSNLAIIFVLYAVVGGSSITLLGCYFYGPIVVLGGVNWLCWTVKAFRTACLIGLGHLCHSSRFGYQPQMIPRSSLGTDGVHVSI